MKRRTVLVVARTPGLVDALLPVLDPRANDVVVAHSFTAGKRQLALQPDLLITELRLGEYNGLHLALRAQAQSVPTIVIGHADPVLQREAVNLGASYVATDEPVAGPVEALLHDMGLQPTVSDIAWGMYSGHPRPSSTTAAGRATTGARLTTSSH